MSQSKRSTRKTTAGTSKARQLPMGLIVFGGVATVTAGFVGARGPTTVIQELKESVGIVQAPRIVSLQPTPKDGSVFIVSIENPSLRQIQITAYTAEPAVAAASMSQTSSGPLPLVDAEDVPAECLKARRVAIARPLVIDAGAAGGLTVRPWNERCDFRLSVEGTTGVSKAASWTPNLNKLLCDIPSEWGLPPRSEHK